MHPFPAAKDVQFFVGVALNIVFVARYQYRFDFENGISLIAENRISYKEHDGAVFEYDIQENVKEIMFTRLIGEKIVSLNRADWSLSLVFASGRVLTVHSEDGRYESGQIVGNKGYIF